MNFNNKNKIWAQGLPNRHLLQTSEMYFAFFDQQLGREMRILQM